MKVRLAIGIPPGSNHLTQVTIEGPGAWSGGEAGGIEFVRARCGLVTIVEFELPEPLTWPEPITVRASTFSTEATVDKSAPSVPTSS